ncbi:MAG: sigma-70 family RNA polymerase sigma factor [Gemmatimonadota bacterium]|nr:MAG: sigma-70 family RNA polymerase sigma factor [Gemmatimonadota bacterium]
MVKEEARNVPDAELVRLAKGGDREALDELCARHVASVYRMCRGILGDDDEAADATQDCFVKAVRSLHRFRGDASFRTWLLTIAGNEAKGFFRKRKRRAEQALESAGPLFSDHPEAGDVTALKQEAEQARVMVAELPTKQRLAVRLRIDEGLSFREIGEIIGSSEGAARVNYHHGIRRLREMMT